MAFHLLDKYAKNDATVKLVFDHLRNVGIGIAFLGAAGWSVKHSSTELIPMWDGLIGEGNVTPRMAQLWDILVSAWLGLIGFGLLWFNAGHLHHRMNEAQAPRWARVGVFLFYFFAFGTFVKYATGGKG